MMKKNNELITFVDMGRELLTWGMSPVEGDNGDGVKTIEDSDEQTDIKSILLAILYELRNNQEVLARKHQRLSEWKERVSRAFNSALKAEEDKCGPCPRGLNSLLWEEWDQKYRGGEYMQLSERLIIRWPLFNHLGPYDKRSKVWKLWDKWHKSGKARAEEHNDEVYDDH